ncbi:TPA: polysaccharide biosynthesis tyrosine autokinase [Enterobacter cancerogenus]|nr:polysaccharide biosynthesis tyrosine autokinase [Enterobacter cancerogenus]
MTSYSTDNYGAAAPQASEVDFVRLLGEAIDHRVKIVCITLLFTLLAGAWAFFTTPVYQADALVQIESKQENGLLKNLGQLDSGLLPDATPEILLLKSRMILGETVENLGLTQQVHQRVYPVIGRLWERIQGRKPGDIQLGWLQIPHQDGKPQTLVLTVQAQGQYSLDGDNFHAQGAVGKPLAKAGVYVNVQSIDAEVGTEFTLKTLTKLEAINALSKSFTVKEMAKQSGMLALTLTGKDPQKITKVLNGITSNFLKQNIARQEAQDTRSLAFLERQLPKISGELDEAEERLNAYRKQRDSVDLTLEAKSILDQVVNVENQLNELTFREAEISQLFKKDHPTYRALREKRQTLENERSRLNHRVSTMPTTQQEILRLSRDVESGRTIYLQLLTRQQELNISRSSAIGNVRIIDQAETQPEPIKPKKALIIVLGFVAGLALSLGYVIASVALKRGIMSSEQLEPLGVPVLATLPRSVWLWKKTHLRSKSLFASRWRHTTSNVPFLPVDRPADSYVEAVRGLRTSLYFTMMDAANRIVMFSGPTQDCGKTLVSTSLSAIAAQSGQKVLFIDADMREGYVHKIFGLNNDCGLSSVLEGKCDGMQAIQRFEKAGIDVMTSGPTPTHPAELLMNERFRTLMAWANERYDLVVIDTPPVLAVTDASLAAQTAGITLLVSRYAKTSVKEIENSLKRLQQSGVGVSGIILNDIIKSAALYYSEGYSQYDYGYTPKRKQRKG